MSNKTNLKNYTSTVSVQKSISKIEDLLVAHGALNISKQYVNRELKNIFFQMDINGTAIPFSLKSRIDECYKIMLDGRVRINETGKKKLREQSERTAWKLLCDWVEVQMSMVALDQMKFMQVFLPYVVDASGDTLFERLERNNFQNLLAR